MPCDYAIDVERGLVRTRLWGSITQADVLDVRERIAVDPAFSPHQSILIDLREVERLTLTTADVQALAGTSTFGRGARRAVVASSPSSFGLARMFQSYRELNEGLEETAVFETMEAAEAWLRTPPDDQP